MIAILEGYCRNRPYCYAGNVELAAAYGCKVRNLQGILAQMEHAGIIRRVKSAGAKEGRVGIILIKRADPSLPVADTDEALAQAIAALGLQRAGTAAPRPSMQENAPSSMQENAPSSMQENAPELKSSSKKDPTKKDGAVEPDQVPRRRSEAPVAELSPEIRAVATPPAVPALPTPPVTPPALTVPQPALPVPSLAPMTSTAAQIMRPTPTLPTSPQIPAPAGLTAGQLAVLAELDGEQRARFDQWSPGRQSEHLTPHAGGIEPLSLRVLLAELRVAPPPPLPAADADAAELIEALSGRMGRAIVPRCADALMRTLGDRGGHLSFGAIDKRCREVAEGLRPAESLAGPLAKTLAELGRAGQGGREPIRNAAAFWTRAVENWDREHPRPMH